MQILGQPGKVLLLGEKKNPRNKLDDLAIR